MSNPKFVRVYYRDGAEYTDITININCIVSIHRPIKPLIHDTKNNKYYSTLDRNAPELGIDALHCLKSTVIIRYMQGSELMELEMMPNVGEPIFRELQAFTVNPEVDNG